SKGSWSISAPGSRRSKPRSIRKAAPMRPPAAITLATAMTIIIIIEAMTITVARPPPSTSTGGVHDPVDRAGAITALHREQIDARPRRRIGSRSRESINVESFFMADPRYQRLHPSRGRGGRDPGVRRTYHRGPIDRQGQDAVDHGNVCRPPGRVPRPAGDVDLYSCLRR